MRDVVELMFQQDPHNRGDEFEAVVGYVRESGDVQSPGSPSGDGEAADAGGASVGDNDVGGEAESDQVEADASGGFG